MNYTETHDFVAGLLAADLFAVGFGYFFIAFGWNLSRVGSLHVVAVQAIRYGFIVVGMAIEVTFAYLVFRSGVLGDVLWIYAVYTHGWVVIAAFVAMFGSPFFVILALRHVHRTSGMRRTESSYIV